MNEQDKPARYSVVIPVYNSRAIIGETVDRTVAFFEGRGWDYEIIAVNDGSRDGSWDVLREKAGGNRRIMAVNLLRNYGQHTAVFCGLQKSTGDCVITMDDDLQNPPEEIAHLVEKMQDGHDVVFGRFREKKHPGYRRAGSRMIGLINRRIFHQPRDLVVGNFRIMRRDVVDRICAYRSRYPYINGLALMFSADPANVVVEHEERHAGKSQYGPLKIAELCMRILFNYSAFPLRLACLLGVGIAAISFLLGAFYFCRALFVGSRVPGWTSTIVLLSFFNGVSLLILSMLGEYSIRVLTQTSSANVYHVREEINTDV